MKLQTLLLAFVALTLVACGKQSSKNSGSTRLNNRYQTNNIVPGTTTCNQASWGRIYDNNTNEAAFRQRVADLAFRNLDEIGSISPYYNSSTGIEFQTTLAFSGGQLVPSNSRATFKISDSYTIQENAGYIQFVLAGLGGTGGNGYIDAQIGDSKGYVRLRGNLSNQQGQQIYVGQAYYNNNNMGEQYLGEFVIGACAVVGN